jgi:acyl carrier protein
MSVEEQVIEWVRAATGSTETDLSGDTSLIASGRLDSLQILELIEFAEERFEIRLIDEDMHPDNFESIGSVARLIGKRMASPGEAGRS